MKKLLIILLISNYQVFSQKDFKLDLDCFLIGLMDDYGGRVIALENEKCSTFLASFEFNKRNTSNIFLDSICKHFNVSKQDIIKEDNSYYNVRLAKHFNEYFTPTLSSDLLYVDNNDQREYNVYLLKPNENKFDTEVKKLSFLTGMIYSDGNFLNGKITIEKANSHLYILAVKFISELGFDFFENKSPEYNIPNVQIITFTPTKKHEDYFERLSAKIKNGW